MPRFLPVVFAGFALVTLPTFARADGVVATDPSSEPAPAPTLTVAAPEGPAPAVAPLSPVARPSVILSTPIEPTGYRFYGWQSMFAEGFGTTLVAGAALVGFEGSRSSEVGAIATLGGVGYVLGGFLVQAFHDNWRKAGGSLGFTLGLPATGALIGLGAGAAQCDDKGCRERAVAVGALVGVLVAPLADGLALGWQKKRTTYHGDSGHDPFFASVGPTILPVQNGVILGVSGVLR